MPQVLTTSQRGKQSRVSLVILIIVVAILVVLAVGAFIASGPAANWARARMLRTLEETFASRIELKNLNVRLFPSVHISGEGLVFHQAGSSEDPPLISIERFTADTGILSLLRVPAHIREVRLTGLQVHVHAGAARKTADDPALHKRPPDFVIDEVIADGSRVETIPSTPQKVPLVWDLKRLTLHDTGPHRPMDFQATLTNARPPGQIETTGTFGPWKRNEPSRTPVDGEYTFSHADLSVFKGISGTLSSNGKYNGVLERIEVEGNTDTPDFAITVAANRVHLTTNFHALVDGTNGTTRLDPVVGHFGATTVTASGIVDTTPGQPGNIISLDATVRNGRLEDLMRLVVRGKPPMSGAVSFHSKILIPPQNVDIVQKLGLDGTFDADQARFAESSTQEKVDKLSNRGRGQPHDADDDTVASNFRGRFKLQSGVMKFTDLEFLVPGVHISLSGDYGLENGSLDLQGTARLEAKLSQTTTGIKSFLLKAVDPFFSKKGAGTVLPIRITGTRDAPSFGLSLGRKARTR